MDPVQNRRLSLLLEQQAGECTESERAELASLMQSYQEELVRTARALQEAAGGGLRGPLES